MPIKYPFYHNFLTIASTPSYHLIAPFPFISTYLNNFNAKKSLRLLPKAPKKKINQLKNVRKSIFHLILMVYNHKFRYLRYNY